jgi:hypothetical protein
MKEVPMIRDPGFYSLPCGCYRIRVNDGAVRHWCDEHRKATKEDVASEERKVSRQVTRRVTVLRFVFALLQLMFRIAGAVVVPMAKSLFRI